MTNIDLHKSIIITILRAIYSDSLLRNALGFKGGTAAMLFYDLPRFSVDLDFDLLDLEKKDLVFSRLKDLLSPFGTIEEAVDKKYTLFFYINYKKGERNLKVEISKRPIPAKFEVKNYLGISMLVMNKEDMATSKLSALLTRNKFATRDIFDIWYFLKNRWLINEKLLKDKTDLSLNEALKNAEIRIRKVKKTELLAGLGELLDNKQKAWVKEKLIDDLTFELRLYNKLHKLT